MNERILMTLRRYRRKMRRTIELYMSAHVMCVGGAKIANLNGTWDFPNATREER